MEENKIIVIDDNGNEIEYTILFTFESPELNKSFVLYYDEEADGEVFASSYDAEGKLAQLEEEEWPIVEEVFNSFVSQEEHHEHHHDHGDGCCCGDDEECGCNHEHGEDHECHCGHKH